MKQDALLTYRSITQLATAFTDGYDALGEDVSMPSVGSSKLLVIRTPDSRSERVAGPSARRCRPSSTRRSRK